MEKTYKSNYTDSLVTSAQYLTEFICERIAKKEKKVLKWKFWNDPEWNQVFRRQITAANQLLKQTDAIRIMSFLRSKKGQNIYSLGLKVPILKACQNVGVLDSSEVELSSTVKDSFEKEFVGDDGPFADEPPKKSLWERLNG